MIRVLVRMIKAALQEPVESIWDDPRVFPGTSHVIPVPAEMSSKDAWDEIARFGQLAEGKEVPEDVDGEEGEDRWAVVVVDCRTNEFLAEVPDEVLDESVLREAAAEKVRGLRPLTPPPHG